MTRFVICDDRFHNMETKSRLSVRLGKYLVEARDRLELEFTQTLQTHELLLLGADLFIINPENHDKLWEVITVATGMGFPVCVYSAQKGDGVRASALGAVFVCEAKPSERFVLALANFYHYLNPVNT